MNRLAEILLLDDLRRWATELPKWTRVYLIVLAVLPEAVAGTLALWGFDVSLGIYPVLLGPAILAAIATGAIPGLKESLRKADQELERLEAYRALIPHKDWQIVRGARYDVTWQETFGEPVQHLSATQPRCPEHKTELRPHSRMVKGLEETRWRCLICNRRFPALNDLQQHQVMEYARVLAASRIRNGLLPLSEQPDLESPPKAAPSPQDAI